MKLNKSLSIGVAALATMAISSQAASIYFEDFSSDPAYTNNTAIGAAGSAKTYFRFGDYNGAGDIGVSIGGGVLSIGSATKNRRARALTVFIDTSAWSTGTHQVSFDVSNWIAGTPADGSSDFSVYQGSGLNADYLNMTYGRNAKLFGVPYATASAAGTATFAHIASAVGGITSDGAISLDVTLTEAGEAGDYVALAWIQRQASASSAPSFKVDNVSVRHLPEPSSIALLGLGGLALILRRRR